MTASAEVLAAAFIEGQPLTKDEIGIIARAIVEHGLRTAGFIERCPQCNRNPEGYAEVGCFYKGAASCLDNCPIRAAMEVGR